MNKIAVSAKILSCVVNFSLSHPAELPDTILTEIKPHAMMAAT